MSKKKTKKELDCNSCPLLEFKEDTETIPKPRKGAKVCFVHETPPTDDELELLGNITRDLKLKSREWSSVYACRCVDSKKPKPPMGAIKCCHKYFMESLEKANCEVVVCLGASAHSAMVGKNQGKVEKQMGMIYSMEV